MKFGSATDIITAIGVVLTALFAGLTWRAGLWRNRLAKPTIKVLAGPFTDRSKEISPEIHIEIDEPDKTRWALKSARILKPRSGRLSVCGDRVQDEYGQTLGYQPKEWFRLLNLSDCGSRTILLLSGAPSGTAELEVTMFLRASPKRTSRFTTIIRIKD